MALNTYGDYTFWNSAALRELEIYNISPSIVSNHLLLFALQRTFGIKDSKIPQVAIDSLTDGFGDHKCDLIYVDGEEGVAVIAQASHNAASSSTDVPKQRAPEKASELNTALAWVFSLNTNSTSWRAAPLATNLVKALQSGEIRKIFLWYVHDSHESRLPTDNITLELDRAKESAEKHLKDIDVEGVEVLTREIGLETLETLFKVAIKVEDALPSLDVDSYYDVSSTSWKAIAVAVQAEWLYKLFNTYKLDLFSANPREYLGSRGHNSNINYGIETSLADQPENFWVFNNGITAIVKNFAVKPKPNGGYTIDLEGISIVNGAQTTGAIGTSPIPAPSVRVPARFILCYDNKIVQQIVHNNNSQNEMIASDFRSNDEDQTRLRNEFVQQYPYIIYPGARRGGDTKVMSRSRLDSDEVAQSIAAFNGDPELAYQRKKEMWENQAIYESVFKHATADYIVFTYSLHKAIERYKDDLKQRSNPSDVEKKAYAYLAGRGADYVLMAALGLSIGIILDTNVQLSERNKFGLGFKVRDKEMTHYSNLWTPIVKFCMVSKYITILSQATAGTRIMSKIVEEPLKRFREALNEEIVSQRERYESAQTMLIYREFVEFAKEVDISRLV